MTARASHLQALCQQRKLLAPQRVSPHELWQREAGARVAAVDVDLTAGAMQAGRRAHGCLGLLQMPRRLRVSMQCKHQAALCCLQLRCDAAPPWLRRTCTSGRSGGQPSPRCSRKSTSGTWGAGSRERRSSNSFGALRCFRARVGCVCCECCGWRARLVHVQRHQQQLLKYCNLLLLAVQRSSPACTHSTHGQTGGT